MSNDPLILRRVAELRAHIGTWRRDGQTIALVPTMGALHDGHLSLVRAALQERRRCVVSIFVNPTQFGPNEDLGAYPRREAQDLAVLASLGAGPSLAVWAPAVEEMYPPSFATTITVAGITDALCGPFRPGHFAGVATVVAKLFQQVQPDLAVFGEKDWQQLQVIRRMVRDLDMPVQILSVATLREADGLARSSRNAYLSEPERQNAAALPQVLRHAIAQAILAEQPFSQILATARQSLIDLGYDPIDYLSIADAETLLPVTTLYRPARIFVAARLGRTRLIDNMPVAAASLW